jgi:predicted acetyltransferase
MTLTLRTLTLSDEQAFYKAVADWPEAERGYITFDWKPGMLFSEHLEKLDKDMRGIDLPESFVPHTMFYGFVNDNIVGRVSVRHELNEFLLNFGGHMGYAVSRPYRNKGYAKEMVNQCLPYFRQLGLQKILVTCDDDNLASKKIILNIGGQLENKVYKEAEGKYTCRYWVDI